MDMSSTNQLINFHPHSLISQLKMISTNQSITYYIAFSYLYFEIHGTTGEEERRGGMANLI
jgi:hypothetical protein